MTTIIEVGANSGHDTREFSYLADFVYAFEPSADLCNGPLKQLADERPNVTIIQKAVSDYTGKLAFNLDDEGDKGCSSLLSFNDNLDKTWPGRTDLKMNRAVEVEVIKLYDFVREQQIRSIDYLHVDAQGSDLNVLKGLMGYISIVKRGVIEMPRNSEVALYKGQYTLWDAQHFLVTRGFTITDIRPNDINCGGIGNEVNVYFEGPALCA